MALSLKIFLLVVGLSLCPTPAWAVPPPMSSDQLMAASDIVVLVRVVAVTCTALVRDLPSYRAQLEILAVKKGNVREHDMVFVMWSEIPQGLLGSWVVQYFPGEELWTYLKWDQDTTAYTATWWNARGESVRTPDTQELPRVIGGVISAKSIEHPIISPNRK